MLSWIYAVASAWVGTVGKENSFKSIFFPHLNFIKSITIHPSFLNLFSLYPLFLALIALFLTSHYSKSASIPEREIVYHLSHKGTVDIFLLLLLLMLFLFLLLFQSLNFRKIYFLSKNIFFISAYN